MTPGRPVVAFGFMAGSRRRYYLLVREAHSGSRLETGAEGITCQRAGCARDRHQARSGHFRRGVPMENDSTAGDGPGLDRPASRTSEQEPGGTGFAGLDLGPAAMQAVASLGYESPTTVQERAIPVLLEGRDLIAQAPTGTGKTAAYGLPIVDQLTERDRRRSEE